MSDINNQSNFGDGNFAEYIARERERLHAEREQIFTQQEELQRRLDAINRSSPPSKLTRGRRPARQRDSKRRLAGNRELAAAAGGKVCWS